MGQQLTIDDARQSMLGHVTEKGTQLREKYGHIGWEELGLILEDRAFVRYPCRIVFDATPLRAGEFAFPQPATERPEDGFIMHVHPRFAARLDKVPWLVLYQLVIVNYGEFASSDDAEAFGAAALGISTDYYYAALCEMADQTK